MSGITNEITSILRNFFTTFLLLNETDLKRTIYSDHEKVQSQYENFISSGALNRIQRINLSTSGILLSMKVMWFNQNPNKLF